VAIENRIIAVTQRIAPRRKRIIDAISEPSKTMLLLRYASRKGS
jgi:hypothetical protein